MTNTHIPEVAIPSVFPSHHKKCSLIANTLFIFQYFYLQFRISFRLPVAALLIFPLYIRQVVHCHRSCLMDVTTGNRRETSSYNRDDCRIEMDVTTGNRRETSYGWYYVSQFCVSSKYLTVISKKNSGKTSNEWIQEYKLSVITNSLRTTDLSSKEIRSIMFFPTTSFFGKYVKGHPAGCSLLEYRRRGKIW